MIVVVGLSHRTAPIEIRERLALPVDSLPELLRGLVAGPAVGEALVVSTCNRVEFVVAGTEGARSNLGDAARAVIELVAARAPLVSGHLYQHVGRDAVRHLFRVAASLDSLVVGEPQILGQVKESVRNAENAGTLGQLLGGVFRKTFSVAKQVRSETALGGESISMAAAALRLAQNIFGDLSRTSLVLVGVGEMVELAATYFVAQRPASVKVANRTLARGEEFAERFGGTAISLAELPDHLHEFDIVVTGTASTLPILGKGMFERALKARRRRPMFVVDFAVPRDVEPEVSKLEDVFLYTIDDLGNVVSEGRERRQAAAAEAEAIVEAQVGAWSEWQASRGAAPAIVELRRRAEQYREAELAKARARLAKGEDPTAVIDALARGLANKFLHHPSQALSRASEGEREQLARAIETLYPDPERDAGET